MVKTIQLEDDEKKYLDAIADVMGWTLRDTVQRALYQMCPVPEWMKLDEKDLRLEIAKRYISKLHYQQAEEFCREHGLEMSDLGYPSEEELREMSD